MVGSKRLEGAGIEELWRDDGVAEGDEEKDEGAKNVEGGEDFSVFWGCECKGVRERPARVEAVDDCPDTHVVLERVEEWVRLRRRDGDNREIEREKEERKKEERERNERKPGGGEG